MSGLILAPSCMVEDVIPERNIPTLTASGASDISRNSAVINGSISGKDLSMVKSFGFKFGPDEKMSQTIAISGTPGTMKYEVTGLEAGKAYYYTVFLTNGISTLTGTTKVFTTISVLAATVANLKVEKSGAVFNASAEITDDGGSDIKSVGFCYGLEPEPSTQNAECKTITTKTDESGSFFSAVIEEFEPGKTYYVRAFVDCDLNGNGSSTYSYSEQLTFVSDAVAPSVETLTPDDSEIMSSYAEIAGKVISDGGDTVTERGFVWSRSENPTLVSGESVKCDGGVGEFSARLEGLTLSTTYYVRAYAQNSVGIAYGNQVSFTTKEGKPSVMLIDVGSITNVSAMVSASVLDAGTADVLECGAVWATSSNPTISNDKVSAEEPVVGPFNVTVSKNLEVGVTYYVRAFARNENGVSYSSEEKTFSLRTDVATVSTGTPTNISSESVDISGDILNDFGNQITEKGFVWSDMTSPTLENAGDNRRTVGSGTGSFSATIFDLAPATEYRIRAYAISSAGTSYGNEVKFTTLASVPVIKTEPVSDEKITEDSAEIVGNIQHTGGSDILERGFYWGKTSDPVNTGRKQVVDLNKNIFTLALKGLDSKTYYYFVAYARNSEGVAYGEELSFTTKTKRPTITTADVKDISSTSATVGGNVVSVYEGTALERGVVWGTKENPTISDNKFEIGSGEGEFSAALSGLQKGTVYYVRAYVTTEDWSAAYGEQKTFMTDGEGEMEDWNNNEYQW